MDLKGRIQGGNEYIKAEEIPFLISHQNRNSHMAEAVNAYVRMMRGSRGVIDDIEAQRRIDAGLPTNSLLLPPTPLARLPAIQPVPEYQGKTAKFLMVSFAGFKKQPCSFTWSNTAPQFGNAHAYNLMKEVAQSMCGPMELVEKIVITFDQTGFVEIDEHLAMKLLFDHAPKHVIVYTQIAPVAVLSRVEKAKNVVGLLSLPFLEGIYLSYHHLTSSCNQDLMVRHAYSQSSSSTNLNRSRQGSGGESTNRHFVKWED
jgi:hypothetical protein